MFIMEFGYRLWVVNLRDSCLLIKNKYKNHGNIIREEMIDSICSDTSYPFWGYGK